MVGSILKKKNIKGFIDSGFFEIHNIISRHKQIAFEMMKRGMVHKSELPVNFEPFVLGSIDREKSKKDLIERCPDCKTRIQKLKGEKEKWK